MCYVYYLRILITITYGIQFIFGCFFFSRKGNNLKRVMDVKMVLAYRSFTVLFLGPYAVESFPERASARWKETLGAELQASLKFVQADPPFSTDTDIEPKGYWMLLAQGDKEKRIKELRRQAFIGLVAMLTVVERR